jgi:hypothetical protein
VFLEHQIRDSEWEDHELSGRQEHGSQKARRKLPLISEMLLRMGKLSVLLSGLLGLSVNSNALQLGLMNTCVESVLCRLYLPVHKGVFAGNQVWWYMSIIPEAEDRELEATISVCTLSQKKSVYLPTYLHVRAHTHVGAGHIVDQQMWPLNLALQSALPSASLAQFYCPVKKFSFPKTRIQ